MISLFSITFLSCAAAVLPFGRECIPFIIILFLAVMVISKKLFHVLQKFAVPLFLVSCGMRFGSVFYLCRDTMGIGISVFLIAICFAMAVLAAYNSDAVRFISSPLLLIIAIIALYTVFISFGTEYDLQFKAPSVIEWIISVICTVSISLAVSKYLNELKKAVKGVVIGAAIALVFFAFKGTGGEFGFIIIPLTVVSAAFEIKAVYEVIYPRKPE